MAEFCALCDGLKLIVQYDISCSEFLIECDSMFLNTITIGTHHSLDPLTIVKARVNNFGKANALIQHEFFADLGLVCYAN
ncbi:unnamed protein product [Ilex paraguariensis]|uniref:RNase H type-1 domain-containing protein n=1 Tax=Ilex paraguariensis TaxID=185542 RepID=A0ABC8SQG4_9AQUA